MEEELEVDDSAMEGPQAEQGPQAKQAKVPVDSEEDDAPNKEDLSLVTQERLISLVRDSTILYDPAHPHWQNKSK